jgi:hypothetical protein
MHQQLWGYKVEEKLYVGVCKQKRLNTTGVNKSTIHFIKKNVDKIRAALRTVLP